MPEWANDDELFTLARRELFTSVVGDVCDQLGLRQQFIDPRIRPLHGTGEVPVLIGRALTVLENDVSGELSNGNPFGLMLEALDSLRRNEIYICAGASPRYALVGELMCVAMQCRGAAGAVCDGYIRDAAAILRLGYPVYSLGPYGQDQRGRGLVLDYRVPIEISGVRIEPGDIVMGDIDGVLVVPKAAESEVFVQALAKARAEKVVRQALETGMSASEAFTRYGIL